MQHHNKVIIGQKAFIVKDGKLLCLRRAYKNVFKGFWDVPGGKVNPGEDLKDALARELAEETGMKLKDIKIILTTSLFKGKSKNKITVLRNIYLVSAEGKIQLSNEHNEYKWIKIQNIKNSDFSDDKDFQKALALLKDPKYHNLSDNFSRII